MTDEELDAVLKAHTSDRIQTHHDECHLQPRHVGCAVAKLVAEVRRLRAEVVAAVAARDNWRTLCREAISEGQRAQAISQEWQNIAEGKS